MQSLIKFLAISILIVAAYFIGNKTAYSIYTADIKDCQCAQLLLQMKKNMEEKDAKLKTILTADQFKTYEAKKADMKEEIKKKSEGGGGVKNG